MSGCGSDVKWQICECDLHWRRVDELYRVGQGEVRGERVSAWGGEGGVTV